MPICARPRRLCVDVRARSSVRHGDAPAVSAGGDGCSCGCLYAPEIADGPTTGSSLDDLSRPCQYSHDPLKTGLGRWKEAVMARAVECPAGSCSPAVTTRSCSSRVGSTPTSTIRGQHHRRVHPQPHPRERPRHCSLSGLRRSAARRQGPSPTRAIGAVSQWRRRAVRARLRRTVGRRSVAMFGRVVD